jgi:DNA helicase-2/ATP-dependent DNA helicase PcrA
MNIDDFLDSVSPPAHAAPAFAPSEYQQAIFGAARGTANLLIDAKAGTGKTTTICEAMDHAGGRSVFLAFNKTIAQELGNRIGKERAKTFNGLGHGLWMRYRPGSQLDARKTRRIAEGILGKDSAILKDYGFAIQRTVGLMKNNAFGIQSNYSVDEVKELIDSYDLSVPEDMLAEVATAATRVFYSSNADEATFDFDDQLFGPILHRWSFPHWDNVWVDECQDLSAIQHLMLEALSASRARIGAVGDRHQAIYGFRGALSDSMDLLKRRFNMLELPLNISYRCPQAVIREAQKFCPDIQARPGAPEGLVRWVQDMDGYDEGCDPEFFASDQLILCRNNAPLFKAILRAVRAGKPVRVLSNFLESLAGFIRSFKVQTTVQLQGKLDEWRRKEIEAAQKKGFLGKIAGIEDKHATLTLFCRQCRNVEEIVKLLEKLAASTVGPIFSTIHKAKGLEADSVYILRPDLMPAKYARTAESKQQEANLQYVAITRAKDNLTYGEQPL